MRIVNHVWMLSDCYISNVATVIAEAASEIKMTPIESLMIVS